MAVPKACGICFQKDSRRALCEIEAGYREERIEGESSSTPSEVVREAVHPAAADDIREFITIYEKCRFGGRELTAEDRKRYLALLEGIKTRLKS